MTSYGQISIGNFWDFNLNFSEEKNTKQMTSISLYLDVGWIIFIFFTTAGIM